MRIFILLLLVLVISGCTSQGGGVRPDLNLSALTVNSEEEFRNTPALMAFKSKQKEHSFVVDVPLQTVADRFLYCLGKEVVRESLVKDDDIMVVYENTYVETIYNMFKGSIILSVWELDALSSNKTNVSLYFWDAPIGNSTEFRASRYKDYWAKGISEEDSITYNACKF